MLLIGSVDSCRCLHFLFRGGVIPTILIDAPLSILIGYMFALSAAPLDSNKPLLKAKGFWIGLVFHLVFGMGLPAVCYFISPDWMWGYLMDHRTVPPWMTFYVFAVLYNLCYVMGYVFYREWTKLGGTKWWQGAALILIWQVGIILPQFDRYSMVGTLAEFKAGTGQSLFGGSPPAVGIVLNVAMPVGLVVMFLCYRYFKKQKAS